VSQNNSMTLAGREESTGRKSLQIIERLVLLVAVVIFVVSYSDIFERAGGGIVAYVITWCIFPFVLLASVEIFGRLIQAINRD